MSLVLIWPSTVIRSKEASQAARSAASGSSTTASVWTKQSIVAMFGWIMPPPFAWAEIVTPPAPQGAALGPAVGGEDRVREGAAARGREAPRRLADPAENGIDRQRDPDHAGLGDRDLLGPRPSSAAASHIATASA